MRGIAHRLLSSALLCTSAAAVSRSRVTSIAAAPRAVDDGPTNTRIQMWWCDKSDATQAWNVSADGRIHPAGSAGLCVTNVDDIHMTLMPCTPTMAPAQTWLVDMTAGTVVTTYSHAQASSGSLEHFLAARQSRCEGAHANAGVCLSWNLQSGVDYLVLNASVNLYSCNATVAARTRALNLAGVCSGVYTREQSHTHTHGGAAVGEPPFPEWNEVFAFNSFFPGSIAATQSSATNSTPPLMCVSTVASPRPVPTPEALDWHEKEIACFVHFNMASAAGTQGCASTSAPPGIQIWAPSALDTDAWINTGVSMGCKRFVYVAKHGCGFVAWRSNVTGYNYSVSYANPPYNQPEYDVVDRFVASAQAAGVGYGFYYSVVSNAYVNVNGGIVQPNPQPGQLPITQAQYDNFVLAHLTELWGKFGPLAEVWFDGGYAPELAPGLTTLFQTLQPKVVAFQAVNLMPSPVRWVGSEDGLAGYPCWSTATGQGLGDPAADLWYPAETDFTLQSGDQWFYNPTAGVHSPAELRTMYEVSVGHNTAIIVDIAPFANGSVPAEQVAAAASLGTYITQCYESAPIASTSGSGSVFNLKVPNPPQTIDRIILQEDQTNGQIVRGYMVTGVNGAGMTVPLANGTSIGNKKIDFLLAPVNVSSVQVTVTSAIDTPVFRNIALRACNGIAEAIDAAWEASRA